MESNNIIYALLCPKCGCPRYVGQTIHGMKRIEDHFKGNLSGDDSIHKKRWVQKLLNEGLMPEFKILLSLPTPEFLNEAEIFWINELKLRGCPLTNLTNGGHGLRGFKHTEETRKKMVAWQKGVPKPQWLKDRISKTLMGRPSPKKGKPLSPKAKESHAKARAIPPFKDQFNRIYKTLKEVEDTLGIPKGNVCKVLKGERKSAGRISVYLFITVV